MLAVERRGDGGHRQKVLAAGYRAGFIPDVSEFKESAISYRWLIRYLRARKRVKILLKVEESHEDS